MASLGPRHILSLSGGKDSTALAVFMRDRVPNMEYVFMDTGEELPETYEYLDRLEAMLGISIVRLNPDRPFRHYLEVYRGVLPDARTRWCTRMLKIRPFEQFVGNDEVYSYVGIRYDERERKGYITKKKGIVTLYPFIETGIDKIEVRQILEQSGLGLPAYYGWRSRSGCYFCFFQKIGEWVGLLENHPELFEKAEGFEKVEPETGEFFTWNRARPLSEVRSPEFLARVRESRSRGDSWVRTPSGSGVLLDVLSDENDSGDTHPCTVCML